MTLRKIALIAVGIPLVAGIFSCNSDYESTVATASSAVVRSFTLTRDDSVLAHLDSVYFSIDLAKGLIFNADSLPYGTRVKRLIPVISMLETASVMELRVKRANGTDTVYNYLTNSTDSIDFTNPVDLRVVSFDGLTEFHYTITVNVHKMVADSLNWSEANRSLLPTSLSNPTAQRTAKQGDTFYCLTTDGSDFCMASCTPTARTKNGPLMLPEAWTNRTVSFPFEPDVESFSATDDALYILSAADGELYESTDAGNSWVSTSKRWHRVYGRYGDELIGSVETATGWMMESYPGGRSVAIPASMPVEGASMPIGFNFPMSGAEQIVMVGGRTADGSLSSAAWGFDGTSWVSLSKTALPVALENVAVAMYYSFTVSNSWNVKTYPTLMAFGGIDAEGNLNDAVYRSSDYGYIWRKAPAVMQMPSYMPAVSGAQTFVVESTYTADVQPKIAKPTESWECPYIYMFGGYDADGKLQNALWRGVINRMTFAPIE